jgi:hypothetical protein
MKSVGCLLLASLALTILTGCQSIDPAMRLERDVKVIVAVMTDDVLLGGGGLTTELPKALANHVTRELNAGLDEHGIKHEAASAGAQGAQVTIALTGVQHEHEAGEKPVYRVTYTAILKKPDGTQLFKFDGREASKLLNELPPKVGRYVAKRVAAYYPAN